MLSAPDPTGRWDTGGISLDRPRASVIVLNHNGRHFLDPCLQAVVSQRLDAGFEVLMVDNASGDDSVAHVRTRFPSVRILALDANVGFAGGNNHACEVALGEHIVFLNNDTVVRPGWLYALVSAADSDPTIAAVTSKLVFRDRPGVIQNAGSLLLSDGSGADRGFNEADRGQFEQREEVFGVCGCAALIRRTALEDVGLLDGTFFVYYEDMDLSWRMRLRGWRIVYEPTAIVEHVHAGTSGEWSPLFTFYVLRNRLFMIIKNAPAAFVLGAYAALAWRGGRAAGRALLQRAGRLAQTTHTDVDRKAGRHTVTNIQVYLRVMWSLAVHLPEMLVKRRHIRHGRRVGDEAILCWLYPRKLWNDR